MSQYDRYTKQATDPVSTSDDLANRLPHRYDDAAAVAPLKKRKRSKPPKVDGPLEAVDDPHRLARLFLSENFQHKEGPRLRFHRGEFVEWNHHAWRAVAPAELKAALSTFMKSEFDRANMVSLQKIGPDEPPPHCRKVTRNGIDNTFAALQSLTVLRSEITAPAWLVSREGDVPADEILTTESGLLHLPAVGSGGNCLSPATPRFFTHVSLSYGYDPNAVCPSWQGFLESVWPNDPQSIDTLQDWCGYCLTDDTRLHKLLMIIGPPRSGKGTITRILRELLGPPNIAAPTLGSLADQFGLSSLVAKRLAIVADARLSGRADAVGVVERLLSITGEDPQDIQRKHQSTLAAVRLPIKFLILANELPNLRDTAGALLSRTVLLRMTRSFAGREDRGLGSRLLAELPGILNWAIAGWQRLRERGEFVQPNSARELLADLEDLSSPVGMFIKDSCITGPEFSATVADLFNAWVEWCQGHGRDKPGTEQAFGRDLRAALPQLTAKRFGGAGHRERGYAGIGLRSNEWNGARPHTSADFSIACDALESDSETRERNTGVRGRTRTREDESPRLAREDMTKLPPWV